MAETENAPSNGAPRQGSFNVAGWKLFKTLNEPFSVVSTKSSCIFTLESEISSKGHLLKLFALNLRGPDNDTTKIREFLVDIFDGTSLFHFLREDRRDTGEEMFALGFGNVE